MEESQEIKKLIAPLISIIGFLLLLGGASYAYYTQSIGSIGDPSNIANANMTVQRGCTFLSNATNCVITANTASTTNFTDSYISRAEMAQGFAGNSIAQSSCALNIGVQGQAGCRCTVLIDAVGTRYGYVADSIKAQIVSTNTSHSQSLRSINTITRFNTILKVASTGTAVYENLALTVKAFNLNANQDTQVGVSFIYKLRATPVCSVSDDTYTVTFDANGGSVSTSSKTVTVGDTYGPLPTPTWSGHTFRGWNGKNKINVAKSLIAGIQNGTNVSMWASVVFNNAYVLANLKPSTQYTMSYDVDGYALPTYDTTYSNNLGFLLYSGVSGYSTSVGFYTGYYIQPGDLRSFSFTGTTPSTLYETAANYRFLGYTNRYLLNNNGVFGSAAFTNIQLEEGPNATAYEPYFVTSDTVVTQTKNHTLKAIWD